MATTANRSRMIGFALTTALASTTLAGCAGQAAAPASVSAQKADKAISKGKASKAVVHAEAAVQAEPQNGAFRAKLGSAYLEDGRFASAVTAFDDAMKLGESSPRTALSLALALTAMNQGGQAQAILSDWENEIAESDLGLAFTLAGNPQRGIHILSNALRGGDDTAKTRQNLAYSYAMAGQWREARLMAAQDVPADKVGARMEEWANAAHGSSSAMRIAKLLNVKVAPSDAGMPTALALGNNPTAEQLASQAMADDNVELAEANEYAVPDYSGANELPPLAVANAPVPAAAPAAPAYPAAPADLPPLAPLPDVAVGSYKAAEPKDFAQAFDVPTNAPMGNMAASAPKSTAPKSVAPKSSAPRSVAARGLASAPKLAAAADEAKAYEDAGIKTDGTHLVQLGSFASEQGARRAWGIYTKRYPELANHQMVITQAVVRGKKYWRVSAGGYQKASASNMCSKVKSGGKGCFAWAEGRPLPGAIDTGVRMARNEVRNRRNP